MKRIVALLLFFAAYTEATTASRNQIEFGPQVIYVKRAKKGGTKQSGDLYGVRLRYDRLKRYGWYIGAEGSWAEGRLKGHTPQNPLHSTFTDQYVEGRLGYTFQEKCRAQAFLTPYVGGGYLEEKNYFSSRYSLPLHVKTYYPYISAGVLLGAHLSESWDVGLRASVKLPCEPKCRISHDPEFPAVKQTMGERLQYRVELPVAWTPCCQSRYAVVLTPFYEARRYPSFPNFPFDYYKNSLNFFGVSLAVQIKIF